MGASWRAIVGDVVADFLDHPLLAVHRASAPAHVWGGPLDLLFPGNAEQTVHPMLLEHVVNGLHERRFVGDLPFAPTSRGRQGRQLWSPHERRRVSNPAACWSACMGERTTNTRSFHAASTHRRRTTGPLKLIALGREHLVPSVIGAPYPC